MTLTIVAAVLALGMFVYLVIMPGGSTPRTPAASNSLSSPSEAPSGMQSLYFPTIDGKDIDGRPFNLPSEFEGRYNLLLIAYDRYHQRDVDTWISPAREIEEITPQLRVYEIPTVPRMSWLMRKQLDYWMSRGIADPKARATTITLYTDVEAFNEAMGFPDDREINLALVDNYGKVYWRDRGPYDPTKLRDFENALTLLLKGQQADREG